jgi:hypothetical protein
MILSQAQFLGTFDLCTANTLRRPAIPGAQARGYRRVQAQPVFFTHFVEKIVSKILDRKQSP